VISYLGDLDLTLFHYVNSSCGQSLALDRIANRLEDGQLKGLALRSKDQFRRRQTLILLLVAILPFRLRPMFAADVGYRAPHFHTDSRVTTPRSSLSWRPAFGLFLDGGALRGSVSV
jgi:hypothetical protein